MQTSRYSSSHRLTEDGRAVGGMFSAFSTHDGGYHNKAWDNDSQPSNPESPDNIAHEGVTNIGEYEQNSSSKIIAVEFGTYYYYYYYYYADGLRHSGKRPSREEKTGIIHTAGLLGTRGV